MVEVSVKRKSNGVPIISNIQIEDWAISLLRDYDESLLKEPKPIDIESFIEFYLGLKIGYEDLTHNQSILGTIALSDGSHIVYDREHNDIQERELKAGDVLIDNSLLEYESEGRRNFTLAHEAGHFITLQPIIKSRDKNQFCLFDDYKPSSVIQCRTSHLNSEGSGTIRTCKSSDIEWMEWHADSMGAALLMPKPAMEVLVKDIWEHFHLNGKIILRRSEYVDMLAKEVIPTLVAQEFKVSYQSARIRLKKLNYISENANEQLVIYLPFGIYFLLLVFASC